MAAWLLVERADAVEEDRDRTEELAGLVGGEIRRTDDPTDLDRLIDDLAEGVGIVVCGGDGSLHHAANALYRCGALERVTLALLPAGTGNDFAGHLGLPTEPADLGRLLERGRSRPIDLMHLTCGDGDLGVAVNAVHTGIGVEAAEQAQDLKEALGDLAYPIGSLRAGMKAEGWMLEVLADGERLDDRDLILMAAVTNGATIGGGRPVSPTADVSDGRLEVMVSHAVGPAARAAFGVGLARGTHLDRDDVVQRTAKVAQIGGHEAKFNVDGELLDRALPDLRVEVMPGRLHMIAPD
jgi:YegS/Rv2252/BmrU family lipid kinase